MRERIEALCDGLYAARRSARWLGAAMMPYPEIDLRSIDGLVSSANAANESISRVEHDGGHRFEFRHRGITFYCNSTEVEEI